jgi:hypothetical protein
VARVYGRINTAPTPITQWTADSMTVTADSSITVDGTAGMQGNTGVWVEVSTDNSGDSSLAYITAFAQALSLNLNESPFYAANGLPQQQSVVQQTSPDYYVTLTQQQYAQYFASLAVVRIAPTATNPIPVYQITALTFQGATINASVPIPL